MTKNARDSNSPEVKALACAAGYAAATALVPGHVGYAGCYKIKISGNTKTEREW